MEKTPKKENLEPVENPILICVRTQNSVNQKFSGNDWIEKAMSPDTNLNYSMAVIDELWEFFRSFIRYEWWKPQAAVGAAEIQNAQVELIDVLHFAISYSLVDTRKADPNASIDDISKKVADAVLAGFSGLVTETTESSFRSLLACAARNDTFDWRAFASLCRDTGITTIQSLVSRYIAKAALNKFRKANGYSEGTYQKYWLGNQEDNFYLYNWLDSLPADQIATEVTVADWLASNYPGKKL